MDMVYTLPSFFTILYRDIESISTIVWLQSTGYNADGMK